MAVTINISNILASTSPLSGSKLPPKFLPEPVFRDMFIREYKRTERTNNHFFLVVIDAESLLSNGKKTELPKLYSIIKDSTRQMDIAGWYKVNTIFGIIYPDITIQTSSFFVDRIKNKLSTVLSPEQVDQIKIFCIQFPQQKESENRTELKTYKTLPITPAEITAAKRISLVVKRLIDLFLAVIGLTILSPILFIIAGLIRFTSPGPVLFRQERIGLKGKKFTMFKFRSMIANNDSSIHKQFVTAFIKGKDVGQECGGKKVMKITNDPRITTIGRLIRKTSLDELPQLFNVLTGDMSFVGPRPPIPYEVDAYSLWHKRRVMDVKPGITGIWQVYGRSITDFDGMVRMDINYIKQQSLLLDLKLIVMTPFSLFSSSGAF